MARGVDGGRVRSTRLVLVAGGGRTPPALDKAGKAHGSTVAPATEQIAGVLAAR